MATASKPRRNWKRLQPTSLRHALELCKEHARERLNRSVERIAEEMGITDHWTVYKWLQTGRIPANLIRPFESACGIDYVTRWIAASAGKMVVDIPRGRRLEGTDVVALHNGFGAALQLLTDFYASKADPEATKHWNAPFGRVICARESSRLLLQKQGNTVVHVRDLSSVSQADMAILEGLFPPDFPEVWAEFTRVFFVGLMASKELAEGTEARARIAIEQAYVMGHQMGGSQPYIPRGAHMETRRNNDLIRREFRGNNYGELASRYDLSVSRIRSLVRPPKRPALAP